MHLLSYSLPLAFLMYSLTHGCADVCCREQLQSHIRVIQNHIGRVKDATSEHSELFGRIAVHPSTNFPGRTQENTLLQLLRKKPEPDVATAMEEGQKMVARLTSATANQGIGVGVGVGVGAGAGDGGDETDGPEKDLEDRWVKVRQYFVQRGTRYTRQESGNPYTEEELAMGIENVRTGLRKNPAVDEEEEEESDDEEQQQQQQLQQQQQQQQKQQQQQQQDDIALKTVLSRATRGEFTID